jgi:hypothetical protein
MFNLTLTTECYSSRTLTVDDLIKLRRPFSALTLDELRFATYCAYAGGHADAVANSIPHPAPPSDEEDYF